MKIPDRAADVFVMRLATASFILAPLLVFFHECMHFAVINAIGMKAVFLILYGYGQNEVFWCAAFTPLCLRMIGVCTLLPRIIEGQDIPNDEVIFAHFLKLPVVPIVMVSLILGFVCIYMICMILEREKRLRFCVSSLIGGSSGYIIIERIVDTVLLK